MSESPRCYSYIRFSRPEQGRGNSFHRQTAAADKYAADHGLEMDRELNLNDPGVSAYRGKNLDKDGGFGAFLELVNAGKIPKNSVLIVEALDRLTRMDILTASEMFKNIILKDIKIVTVQDGKEYSRDLILKYPEKLIESTHLFILANRESKQKSERIKETWKFKRENIELLKLTGICPAWLKLSKDKKNYEILEGRSDLVRRMFEMSNNGIGIKSISKILNLEGIDPWPVKKRKTIGWQPSYVAKILKSRAVLGEFQPHKLNPENYRKRIPEGDVLIDYFPQIVDPVLFGAVQNDKKGITHHGGKNGKISNLFGGIAICGYCGATMQFVNKSKNYTYLVCDNARRGAGCSYNSYKYIEVEQSFIDYCSADTNIVEIFENDENKKILENHRNMRSSKQNDLNEIYKKIDSHILNMEKNYDREILETLTKIIVKLKNDKKKLQEELVQQDKIIYELELTNIYANKFVCDVNERLSEVINGKDEEEVIDLRRNIRHNIRKIVKKIVFFPVGSYTFENYSDRNKKNNGLNDCGLTKIENTCKCSSKTGNQPINVKNKRFYTIHFLNGNVRKLMYIPDSNRHQVVLDVHEDSVTFALRIGEKIGENITIESDKAEYSREAMEIKKSNPNLKDEDILKLLDEERRNG